MILNLYTYKGSKQSIIGPWVTVGYLLTDDTLDCEHRIPNVKDIYNRRKSINIYDDLLKGYLNIKTSSALDINFDGEYCIKTAEDVVIRGFRGQASNITVNRIVRPTRWYERLTILVAVFIRTEYLRRNSRDGYNLLELDNNLQQHIELLMGYKYLPPSYLWDKTMDAVKNIEPKPRWWFREMNTLRRDLDYDAPC